MRADDAILSDKAARSSDGAGSGSFCTSPRRLVRSQSGGGSMRSFPAGCVAPSGRNIESLASALRVDGELSSRNLNDLTVPHGTDESTMPQPSSFLQEEMVSINLPEVHFNWQRTFRQMVLRRLERYLRGTYHKQRALSGWKLLTLLFVILAVGLVTFNFGSSVATHHYFNGTRTEDEGDFVITFQINLQKIVGENLWEASGWVFTGVVVLLISLKVVEVVRWCVLWLVVGVAVYLVLQGVPSIRNDPKHGQYLYVNLGLTLGFEVLTVFAWYMYHILYPKAVEKLWFPFNDLERYWSVKAMPNQASKFRYSSETFWPLSAWLGMPDRHFGYDGELDADGRPHGVGTWHDTSVHGETLHGVWRHGYPTGPFRATEYASGFSFRSVRLAFVHSRIETDLDACYWKPARHPEGLHWGVVAVECSVAGHFFRNLPAVTTVTGPETRRSARWCMDALVTLQDTEVTSNVYVTAGMSGIEVSGHERAAGHDGQSVTIKLLDDELGEDTARRLTTQALSQSRCDGGIPRSPTATSKRSSNESNVGLSELNRSVGGSAVEGHTADALQEDSEDDEDQGTFNEVTRGLRVEGWTSTSGINAEAIIFLHGFNSSMSDALKRVAQLWTLGDFPPHLKPFVFGWPAGRELTYFQAKNFIEGEASGPIVADFVRFVQSLVHAGVHQIHILAHSMGARLVFSALEALSPHLIPAEKTHKSGSVRSRGTRQSAASSSASLKVKLSTVVLMNPDASLQRFLDHDYAALRRVCSHITLYGDNSDGALFWSETFNREKALGKHPFELASSQPGKPNNRINKALLPSMHPKLRSGTKLFDRTGKTPLTDKGILSLGEDLDNDPFCVTPLDMDVIDTSWMDVNVHAMRHNIFNVNRWVVDDLREIVYTQKRARLRNNRLIHRSGNVFAFLAAPKHIVNP